MRRLILLATLAVGCTPPPAAPNDATNVAVSQDPAAASAAAPPTAGSHPRASAGGTTAGAAPAAPPMTLEGAIHFEVEPKARKCYEQRAAEDSRVGEGTVNIRIVVRPTGPVIASDLGSTLNDKATIDCIIGTFSRLTWRPTDGREVDSTIPFTFIKG
jgi:hypothetical protein